MPRINDSEKSIELPQLNRPANSDRHSQSQKQAHQASVQDKAVLSVRTKDRLKAVNAGLEKIAGERTQAIESVSDTLAYLYSPQTFQAEVMSRTAEKLGIKGVQNPPAPGDDQVLTLDALADCFSDFASSVEYPAIAPTSPMGCLPM